MPQNCLSAFLVAHSSNSGPSSCWLLILLGLSLLGCTGQVAPKLGPQDVLQECPIDDPAVECALVQILIHGLAVIDSRDLEDTGRLDVCFRKANNHDVKIYTRDGRDWVNRERPGEDLSDVSAITFNLGTQGLQVHQTRNPRRAHPQSAAESRDHRWLLRSSELERLNFFQSAAASPRAIFEAGTLETCGLVHDEHGNVCRIRSGGLDKLSTVDRSLAEYMVVRHAVRFDRSHLIVYLDGRPMKVPFTELASPIVWRDKCFFRVYDVVLQNIRAEDDSCEEFNLQNGEPDGTETPRRIMQTQHATWYLQRLFPLAENSWDMDSPVCNEEQCSCEPSDLQPSCFRYFFSNKEFGCIPRSGPNQSICPFVGYP